MKFLAVVALLGISAAVAPAAGAAAFTTSKSTEQFAQCFAAAQGRAGNAWWFVPRRHGGTFSDLGTKAVQAAYVVTIDDRGAKREIHMPQASAGSAEAVRRCI